MRFVHISPHIAEKLLMDFRVALLRHLEVTTCSKALSANQTD